MEQKYKTVAAATLGCKVNFYDTQAILELFEKSGYDVLDFTSTADVYIINTCTVTNLSDKKSRQMIHRAKKQNPNAIIVVTGCFAQTAPDDAARIEGVSLVVGTKNRTEIVSLVQAYAAEQGTVNAVSDIFTETNFEPLTINAMPDRQRAFIKIQEGCDRFCTYCIIPYARGRVKSRPEKQVTDEVKKMAEKGYKEIVLTGIHVASYGKDLGNTSLISVLRAVNGIGGIERIRLSSLDPTVITPEFITELSSLERVCCHFHLSLQSGCDKTLERMNRRYNTKQYKTAVSLIRTHFPDASVTTDIIAGFPGETDADFIESYNFIKETEINRLHVFPFSPKKGTPAYSYENQVSPEVKNERVKRLLALSKESEERFKEKFVNKRLAVLIEKRLSDNLYQGLTSNYLSVAVKSEENIINEIIWVTIDKNIAFYFDL